MKLHALRKMIATDDNNENATIRPENYVETKVCTVCSAELTDSCLLLDMMGHIPGDQDTKFVIVEQHLQMDFRKVDGLVPRQCVICHICWDMVYKFHIFYQMVHDRHTKIKHLTAIAKDSTHDVEFTHDDEDCDNDETRWCTEFVGVKVETSDSTSNTGEEKITLLLKPINSVEEHRRSMPTTPDMIENGKNISSINEEIESHSSKTFDHILENENKIAADLEILNFYKRIVCDICDLEHMAQGNSAVEYNTLKELNHHMRNVHNLSAALRCPICAKKYRTRVQLLKHKEMHLNPERFRCEKCFEVHHNMDEHVKTRHAEKPHSCSECGKRFAFKVRLAVHMRISHAARDIECNQCNKSFNKYTIEEHKQAVHTTSFICEYCPKTFKSRFWLNRHMEQHDEAGPNFRAATCTICNAVVKNKYILVAHMRRMHTVQSAVNCKSCGKAFKSKYNLNKHIRNVCTDRSFPCAACGKLFKQKVKLHEHMTTHTGMSLYVCNFCPQTFKYESRLYTHRKKDHPTLWLEMQQKKREGFHHKIQRIGDAATKHSANT